MTAAKRRVPCKLNNVTENTKHQKRIWLFFKALKKACVTIVNYISLKLRLSFDKIDLSGSKELFRYHFIESLILAQDERWRRA